MLESARTRAFYYAAETANPTLLRQVLKDGLTVPIDAVGNGGVAWGAKPALYSVLEHSLFEHSNKHLECLQLLINAGANVNSNQGSAIVRAAQTCCTPCLQFLLEHGAVVDNSVGKRALTLTTLDCQRLLVQHGADPEVLTADLNKQFSGERYAFLAAQAEARAYFQQQLVSLFAMSPMHIKETGILKMIIEYARLEDFPIRRQNFQNGGLWNHVTKTAQWIVKWVNG